MESEKETDEDEKKKNLRKEMSTTGRRCGIQVDVGFCDSSHDAH